MEIEGYENYLIYEDGKVYSKHSKRYLKQGFHGRGYLYVNLWKDGKGKNISIHRLIGDHYIPNPENKRCIDHKNRIRTDNRIENLRWATDSENQQNTGVSRDNKSGIKNIFYDKSNDRYHYNKMFNKVLHQKYFKTFEEAVEYKKDYEIKYCKE